MIECNYISQRRLEYHTNLLLVYEMFSTQCAYSNYVGPTLHDIKSWLEFTFIILNGPSHNSFHHFKLLDIILHSYNSRILFLYISQPYFTLVNTFT